MSEISIKRAAFISALSKYSTIVLNLAFTTVLARLLTPEDYGIVAVTAVFTTFFSLFADMGIGSGIIQNKELSSEDIYSIFTFSVRIALALGVLFALFSFPMSWFYKDNVYVPVGGLLAVSLVFSTLNMVPNALLLKQKKFVAVGVRTVILCLVSGGVGIAFALLGFRYYALVLQTVINSFFTFLWNYISTRPKLVFRVDYGSIKKIRSYSSFIFGFNIINYFARNSDNLLISRVLGTASLGYYDKAYKLMLYPVNNLTHVITPVLHPILSEHQNEKSYIYDRYIEIVKILSLTGAFIMPFCFYSAEEIIKILFGEKWIYAIPCFKFMSVSIWAQMVTSSSGSIFQSLGDSKRMFLCGLLNAVLTIVAIVLGLLEGSINSVARNVGIIYCIHFVTSFVVLVHFSFGMSFWSFVKNLIPNFCIIGLLFLAGFFVNNFVFEKIAVESTVLKILLRLVILLCIYIFALVIFRQSKYLKKLLKR